MTAKMLSSKSKSTNAATKSLTAWPPGAKMNSNLTPGDYLQYEPELKRSWNLFLDDKRESHITDYSHYYHICRTTLTAKKLCVKFGPPDFLSLDTTLGTNEYGEPEDVLEFLVYLKDRYKCAPMDYQIHDREANPARVTTIISFMEAWFHEYSSI